MFILLVSVLPLFILTTWIAVLWQYQKSGNLYKGLVEVAIYIGYCLLTLVGCFVLSGLLHYCQEGEITIGAVFESEFTLFLLLLYSAIICPLILILGGFDALAAAGELLKVEKYVAKSDDLLDD